MSEQFLYVIAAHPAGPSKIGISADPDRRCRQLQTGHPVPLTVFHREPVEAGRVRLYEKLIHRHMSYLRSHGEWLNLGVQDAILQVQWTLIHYGNVEDLAAAARRPLF